MNRFLTKRKAKKQEAAPKPEIDLAVVLPPADDFRTSLIMPNLSARFSMLREQDDPRSKLGKASDDSVLFPKRQSRLHEFGFVGSTLSDIAEVSSLRSAAKPREPDVPDEYGTDDESGANGGIMSRPRPFEGNVLFGGRQKVYKVSDGKGSGLRGRALYDDDVGTSTFSKHEEQMQQKQDAQSRELQEGENQDDELEKRGSQPRPSITPSESFSVQNFSRRRGTASSTTSGLTYARSSTAATSVTSQSNSSVSSPLPPSSTSPNSVLPPAGLERSVTKTRRLYEQGLDQHIQDQQSSAMTRLNSIQKQQRMFGSSPGVSPISPSKSSINLKERYHLPLKRPVGAVPEPLVSPSISTNSGTPKEGYSSSSSPVQSHLPSPLSPVGSLDGGDPLFSAIDPNDRGKATAMGAFNKPQQKFDEHQYLERQLEMQKQLQKLHQKMKEPLKPLSIPISTEEELNVDSGVVDANPQEQPAEQKPAASPFLVFQNAAQRMKSPVVDTQTLSPEDNTQRTFFGASDDSDDESELVPPPPLQSLMRIQQSTAAGSADSLPLRAPPPLFEHPALRSLSSTDLPSMNSRNSPIPTTILSPSEDDFSNSLTVPTGSLQSGEALESPTLGLNATGLGGLIRTHLRNHSGQSSIYSTAPPTSTADLASPREDSHASQDRTDADTPGTSIYTHSNPWDLEDLDNNYRADTGNNSSSNLAENVKQPRVPVSNDTPLRFRAGSNPTRTGDTDAADEEPRIKHTRDPSTETQAERDAFANELAYRQKAIQENLRMRAEIDARIQSQVPPAAATGAFKALNMLRNKSSRDSIVRPNEPTAKALKMLGIESTSSNASSVSLAAANDADGGRGMQPRLWDTDEIRKGRSPPASSKQSMRSRSNSELSAGRSRSRPARLRADSERALESIDDGQAEQLAPPPRTFENSLPSSPAANRSRSNSRAAGYFDTSNFLNTTSSPGLHSPARLSPNPSQGGFSNCPSPALSPRPSPGFFPSPTMPNAPRHSPASIPYAATFPVSAPQVPPVPAIPSSNTSIFSSRLAGRPRKPIQKSDISEPILISTTSVIDTIDLPAGASLRNGLDEVETSHTVTRKKRFGFGRSTSDEEERPKRFGASTPYGLTSPPRRVEGAMF